MKKRIHYPSIISCNKSCRREETLSVYWGKIKDGLVKERLMTWISSWMSNKKRNTLKGGKRLLAFTQAHGFMAHTSLAINTNLFESSQHVQRGCLNVAISAAEPLACQQPHGGEWLMPCLHTDTFLTAAYTWLRQREVTRATSTLPSTPLELW